MTYLDRLERRIDDLEEANARLLEEIDRIRGVDGREPQYRVVVETCRAIVCVLLLTAIVDLVIFWQVVKIWRE